MSSLLDFFQDYRRLWDAGEVYKPGLAIIFLQREYRLSSPNVLNDFGDIWLNGKSPDTPHLMLLNVAKYFDPSLPHHVKAIKFLDNNISPETRWDFEQIWHGDLDWECPSDTDIRTGLPTGL